MKKQNNGLIKNPFLWLLFIFFLVTGFQYFYSGNNSGGSQQINYTELVQEITDGNVKELTYQPNGSLSKFLVSIKILKQVKKEQVFSFSRHLLLR
ncbi:ATP-dependent metallopeptidase FtsH/Yme1/Tma family protein [Streptococcus pneumoniae]|uniref:ATP-dependent metallopeptidase FtsH/Yme1/Tma family protein n=1 Tax=Streptococcus pneumoniae TaxID=1313 RepID=UPI003417ADAA